jgi:hypothetical protein
MTIPELLRWQWQGYPRYHRSRPNLALHIVVIPAFVAANVTLVAALVGGAWLVAGVAALAMVASIALQGIGHKREPIPPEPFTGPANAVSRLVLEQWITFPRFVLSGGWLRAWREAQAETGS